MSRTHWFGRLPRACTCEDCTQRMLGRNRRRALPRPPRKPPSPSPGQPSKIDFMVRARGLVSGKVTSAPEEESEVTVKLLIGVPEHGIISL